MTENTQYIMVPSRFGAFGLVWKEAAGNAQVQRVLLPREGASMASLLRAAFPGIKPGGCPAVENLAEQMRCFLAGEPVALSFELLALENCSPFQRRVLLAEYQVPRGSVTTYGLNPGADLGVEGLRFENGKSHFDILVRHSGTHRKIEGCELPVPGLWRATPSRSSSPATGPSPPTAPWAATRGGWR